MKLPPLNITDKVPYIDLQYYIDHLGIRGYEVACIIEPDRKYNEQKYIVCSRLNIPYYKAMLEEKLFPSEPDQPVMYGSLTEI